MPTAQYDCHLPHSKEHPPHTEAESCSQVSLTEMACFDCVSSSLPRALPSL